MTASWGNDHVNATDPDSRQPFLGTHCHHLKGVMCGLWSEELFSKCRKSCFEERCNKKGSSMNKSHANVQSQGRTHSEKATQKGQGLATSTSCIQLRPLDSIGGLKNI